MSDKRICIYCGMGLSEDVPHGLRECHLHAVNRIAELEEENDRLQDAWFKDETICPDGSLKPKVSTLLSRIAELEALVDELKPYRDGYDAYEVFPEEGENVIANLGIWLFLAQRRGDKWYDLIGQQAEFRGCVERWWKLPEVTE